MRTAATARDRWSAIAAASGLLYIALSIPANLVVSQPPLAGASAEQIARFLEQQMIWVFLGLSGVAAVFFLVFVLYVARGAITAQSEAEPAAWLPTALVQVGGISYVVIEWILSALYTSLALTVTQLDPPSLRLGYALTVGLYRIGGTYPLALVFAGAAVLLLRGRSTPRWLGWVTATLAVIWCARILVAIVAPQVPLGIATLPLFLVWLVMASATLTLVELRSAPA